MREKQLGWGHIISISSVYPNPAEPGLGLFVRSRLLHMAALAELVVVSPVAAIDYSNPERSWFRNLRLASHRKDLGVEVFHPKWIFPPGGTPINVLCLVLRLVATLIRLRARRYRFGLIDAHFGYPEGVAAVLLGKIFRCPVAVTLRGSERRFASYRYRRVCLEWALRRADAVFAVSEELRRFAVTAGADPARTRTIPNGIDREVFHPRNRVACRKAYGMRDDHKVIVSAGELIKAKGHHMVMRAVRDLLEEGHNVDLYVAGGVARGEAPFNEELGSVVRDGNLGRNVHMIGWINRERLAELMCAADVFCLASFTEGWPNVVNEALACGTPVVATRVGAVPEMLANKCHGIIVPPQDQAALTDGLRRALLMDWNRETIARWGQSRCWEDVARDVLAALQHLVPGWQPVKTGSDSASALIPNASSSLANREKASIKG